MYNWNGELINLAVKIHEIEYYGNYGYHILE